MSFGAVRVVLCALLLALAGCRSDASGLSGVGPEDDVDGVRPPAGETPGSDPVTPMPPVDSDAPDASPVDTDAPDASAPVDADVPDPSPPVDAGRPDGSVPIDPGPPNDPRAPDPDPVEGDDATDFISQLPRWLGDPPPNSPWRVLDGTSAASASQQQEHDALAARTLTRIDGNRLYAFTARLGLSIFDLSDPSRIRLLGRRAVGGMPLEAHVEGGIALVVSEYCGTYAPYDGSTTMGLQIASCIQALSVEDPANIRVLAQQVLPGAIKAVHRSDTRLYVAVLEKDRCWGCEALPNVRIASFDLSDPSLITPRDALRLPGSGFVKFPSAAEVSGARAYVVNQRAVGASTVNVVDLSDPAGKLALAAELPLKGEVPTAGMISEHDGVLRVVYAPENWLQDYTFRLDTFRIVNPNQFAPLAQLPFQFPNTWTSLSVGVFDGTRAFVAPWDGAAPLVVFDLTDPARPKQAGSLSLLQPARSLKVNGDRVIMLGRSPGANSYKMSIVDVADLTAPKVLSEVAVSDGSLDLIDGPGDENEVFEVFPDQQLIAVPVMSSSRSTACTENRKVGLQLFSLVGDGLALQGFAHQQGRPATAAVHGQRLIGISEAGVEAFDLTDRAAPRLTSSLQVVPEQHGFAAFGDAMLRVSSRSWNDIRTLEVVGRADPMTTEPLGRLELQPLIDPSCKYWSTFKPGLWVRGSVAYLHEEKYLAGTTPSPLVALVFHVVDLSDPARPRLAGTLEVPLAGPSAEIDRTMIVMTERALVVGKTPIPNWFPPNAPPPVPPVSYQIVDLTEPLAPKLAGSVVLPPDVVASGAELLYHRVEPIDVEHGRYCFERLDLSIPSKPVPRESINVPGQPVSYDPASGRLVSVDVRLREQPSNDPCSGVGFYGFDPVKRVCRFYDRYANVSVVEAARARRTSTLQLDTRDRVVRELLPGQARLYAITKPRRGELPVRANPFSFTAGHALRKLESWELVPDGGGVYTALLGDDLFVRDSYHWSLTVSGPDAPRRIIAQGEGVSCSQPLLHQDKLYCVGSYEHAAFEVVR